MKLSNMRLVSALPAILLSGTMLAGCGGGSPTPPLSTTPVTVPPTTPPPTTPPPTSNAAPKAVISVEDVSDGEAFRMRLDASGSSDSDGEVKSWTWKLASGESYSGEAVEHTFPGPGSYAVTLSVTDDDGADGSASKDVVVNIPRIAMPVEVFGLEETIVTRNVYLEATGSVDRISLSCHRCDYRDSGVNSDRPDKVSIRVNDGEWIDINDTVAEAAFPESNYGGVDGGYATIRMTLPITGLVEGMNTLSFRFNGTDGFTNGFRVVGMNLLGASGEVFKDEDFKWDDPTQWAAIHSKTEDIAEGRELWTSRSALKDSPLVDKVIRASCADCHSSGGEDLKYFNYSSESIISRSEFHGLTKLEGEKIASYIRTRKAPAPVQARPWNPPYQPGPGLDSKPVEEWAAGAGLDAVLDHDRDMLDYIFPKGTSAEEIEKVVSIRNTINMREMPIALQFPDWNMWLPEVHPIDIWGDNWETLYKPEYTLETLDEMFKDGGAERLRTDPDEVKSATIIKAINSFGDYTNGFVKMGGAQPCLNTGVYKSIAFRELGRDPVKPNDTRLREDADLCETILRSLGHWIAVKSWETHQRFGLEDAAPDLYPYGEARSWIGHRRAVHEIAPHRSGNNSYRFRHLNNAEAEYQNHAWYQLQATLNAGNRNPQNHFPTDWKYQFAWLRINARQNKVPAPLRMVQSMIKMHQNLDMRPPVDQPGGVREVPEHYPYQTYRKPGRNSWWLTHVAPWRIVAVGEQTFWSGGRQIWRDLEAEVSGDVRVRVQNALLSDWLDKTETYKMSEFERGTSQDHLASEGYIPTPWNGNGRQAISDSLSDHNGVYRAIPFMRDFGLDNDLVDRLIDWGQLAWPRGDWDILREE